MKYRNILFTFLITGFMLLTGCSTDTSKNTDDKVTLDIFNIKTETAQQMDDLVEKFEAEHEDIKINMTTVGGGSDASAALQAKFSSGEEPSIFMIGGLGELDTWNHTLYDLTETELADLAIEGTLEGATMDDRIFGYPMNIEGYSWLVNKELFNKAGLSTNEIESFSDFENAVKVLDENKDELGLTSVFGFSGGETWVDSQYSSHFIAPEFNDSLIETSKAKEIEFEYNNRMKEYIDLANEYNAMPLESMDYTTSVEELFIGEKVAIIHQGNWIVPTLNELDENFAKDKLDILPMFVEHENQGKIAAGAPWYWVVNENKDQKVIDASIEFLTWMYTDEGSMDDILNEFDFIPAYTNFSSDDIVDPVSDKVFTYVNDGEVVPWVHNSYPDGFGENVIGVNLQAYVADQISWEEYNKIIKETWENERSN